MKTLLVFLLLLSAASAQDPKPKRKPTQKTTGTVKPLVVDKKEIEDLVTLDIEPRPLSPIVPTYPPEAKAMGLEGEVMVKGYIDTSGEVIHASIEKSSDTTFNNAALKAFKQTRFNPAIEHGVPLKVWVRLPVMFVLTK